MHFLGKGKLNNNIVNRNVIFIQFRARFPSISFGSASKHVSDLIIAIFMYMIIYVDSFLYRRNSNGIEPWNMSNPAVLPVQRGPAVSSKFANKHANFNASHSGCSRSCMASDVEPQHLYQATSANRTYNGRQS